MGEPETHHFYDFGISGRVPGSQNQLFLFVETPGHLKEGSIPGTYFAKYYLYKSQNLGNPTC